MRQREGAGVAGRAVEQAEDLGRDGGGVAPLAGAGVALSAASALVSALVSAFASVFASDLLSGLVSGGGDVVGLI